MTEGVAIMEFNKQFRTYLHALQNKVSPTWTPVTGPSPKLTESGPFYYSGTDLIKPKLLSYSVTDPVHFTKPTPEELLLIDPSKSVSPPQSIKGDTPLVVFYEYLEKEVIPIGTDVKDYIIALFAVVKTNIPGKADSELTI